MTTGRYRGKKDPDLRADDVTTTRAHTLRREMSPPERLLCSYLRGSPGGVRFRRQHALGPYIADFYCHGAALVVEIDGSGHAYEQLRKDDRRDAWMAEHGIKTVRVTASEVTRDPVGVAQSMLELARERIESA